MSHLRWTLVVCATLFATGCVAENGDGTPGDPPDPQLNPQPLPPVADEGTNRSPAPATGSDGSSSSSSSGSSGSSGNGGTSGGAGGENPPAPGPSSSSSSSSSSGTTVGSGCKFPGLC